jgi:serine/threonine-protein kinase
MTQRPPEEPAHLGRYELLGEIASGGMATVFLARSSGAGGFSRLVAVKRLHPHLESEEEFVRMFLDEARLAARIRHPNVVGTLDVEDRDGLYIVMEYIEGVTLLQLTRAAQKVGERMPVPVAIRIALDTLAGLHAAHELRDENDVFLNLVHRDVSPQNVLLGTDGTARLTDFGIAKASSRLSMTRDGQLKGKISYMAPEQTRRGEALDRRADVFAMGAVVWEVLAGRRLFHGESDVEVLNQLLFEPIPRLREHAPTLPSMLEGAVMKALERDASARYATAAQFAEALERATRMLGGAANHRVVSSFLQRIVGERIQKERARIAQGSVPPEGGVTGSLRPGLTPAHTPSHVRPAANANADRPSVPRAKLRAPTMTGPVYAPPDTTSAPPSARPQTPASPLRARSRPPSLRPPTNPPMDGAPTGNFIPTVPPPPSPALPAVIEFDITEDPDAAPVPKPSPLRALTKPGIMPTPLPAPLPSPDADATATIDPLRLPSIELSYQHGPTPAAPQPFGSAPVDEVDELDPIDPAPAPPATRSVAPPPIEPIRPPPSLPPSLPPPAPTPPPPTPPPVAPRMPLEDARPSAPPRVRRGLWVALALVFVVSIGTVAGLFAAGIFSPVRWPLGESRVRVRPVARRDAAVVAAADATPAVDGMAAAVAPDASTADAAVEDVSMVDASVGDADDAVADASNDGVVDADDASVGDATAVAESPDAVAMDVLDDAGEVTGEADAAEPSREERRARRRRHRHRDE